MKIDIVTIFPRMVEAGLPKASSAGRATSGLLDIAVHNLRDFTTDRHQVVDDVPFGGGPGMVMKPEPLFAAVEAIRERRGGAERVLLTSPAGPRFTQARRAAAGGGGHGSSCCAGATKASTSASARQLATEEVSIGDYVLSGGELPALVMVDAVAGWCRAWSGDEQSVEGGFVHARAARLSALHAAGGVSRAARAGRAGVGPPRRDSRGGGAARRCSARSSSGPDLLATAALDDDEQECWIARAGRRVRATRTAVTEEGSE